MNQTESNEKILELMNKDKFFSQEEIQLFKELMFQCDLKIQNKYAFTPLIYALRYNQSENLNLSKEQWDYLIKNSDLTQQTYNGWTPLMYVLSNNKSENLNVNEEQWDYLIKNSDLSQKDKDGWTPLFYALIYNKDQNLKLSSKQFKTMYNVLNEDQQQITFQKLIQEHVENDHQYLEEINLLLYDCEFKPNEETINWLKENKYQDILEMIEKRNLFFQLNQNIKKIDNHQKITTIKL